MADMAQPSQAISKDGLSTAQKGTIESSTPEIADVSNLQPASQPASRPLRLDPSRLQSLRALAQKAYEDALAEATAEERLALDFANRASIPLSRPKAPSQPSTPTPSLRPSHDALARLLWDPAYDPAHYVVMYEDRFAGTLSRPLREWKREVTDEEFIPLHRIVGIKDVRTGKMVWDREGRVDEMFGSGKGKEVGKES